MEYKQREQRRVKQSEPLLPVLNPAQQAHQRKVFQGYAQDHKAVPAREQAQQRLATPDQMADFTRLSSAGQRQIQRQQQRVAPVLQAAELRQQDDLAIQRTQNELSTVQRSAQASSRNLSAYGLAPAGPLDVIVLQREEDRQAACVPVAPLPLSPIQRQALMQHASDEIGSALTRDARYLPASGRADVAHAAVQRYAQQGLDKEALRDVMVQRAPDSNTRESVTQLLTAQRRQETQAQEDKEERGLLLGHHGLQRQLQDAQAEHDGQQSQSLSERIQARVGAGTPLPADVRRQLERGLNADLSRVRIYDDSEADKLAKSISAVAFTSGQDIFFRAGKYQPGTQTGFALLLHEGTHTVQQAKGQAKPGIDADPGLEQEAVANEGKIAEVVRAEGASPHQQQPGVAQSSAAVQRKAVGLGTASSDSPVQRLASSPPSWQVTATSAQLEGMVHTQLPTLLRNIQMGMMLDQGYYQSRNRGRQVPITPSGQIFLDTLDHLPLSAASRVHVLQAAIEGPHLPDTVRSDLIQAALSAGRIKPAQAKKVLSALTRKKTDVDQISDFGTAVVSRAWDSVLGLLKAAKFIAWDVSSVRMTIDPVGYDKTITTAAQSLQAIVDHPGLLWEALTTDIRDAWKKGEYGKSLGYITFDVGTLALGAPSAVRGSAAAAGRVAGATRVQLMVFKTRAGELSTTLAHMSDDLAQVAGAGLQGPRLAGAGTGGRVAATGRSADQMTTGRGSLEGGGNRPTGEAVGQARPAQVGSAEPLTLANKDLTDVQIEALLKKTNNWSQVEPFVGRAARATDPAPPGYGWRTKNSRLELVRTDAQSGDYAPLTIENGLIVLKTGGSTRGTIYSRYRGNYLKMLEQQGGATKRLAAEARLANGNQLHHLVPANVAQIDPLVLEALARVKGYTIDRGSNILDMPNVKNAAGLIIHNGPHPLFDKYVERLLRQERETITQDGRVPLEKVLPEHLDGALRDVENEIRRAIRENDLSPAILKELEDGGMKLSTAPVDTLEEELA